MLCRWASLQFHHHSLERLIAQILFDVFVGLGPMDIPCLGADFDGLARFIDHPEMLIRQVDQYAIERVLVQRDLLPGGNARHQHAHLPVIDRDAEEFRPELGGSSAGG